MPAREMWLARFTKYSPYLGKQIYSWLLSTALKWRDIDRAGLMCLNHTRSLRSHFVPHRKQCWVNY